MPINEGDLVRGSGPKVFWFHGGRLRWVPDPPTLFAINPNGWSVVAIVPDAELAALPQGPVLPSRADGNIYRGATKPEVYLARDAHIHHIPDPETLATFGGWARVVVIDQTDCDDIPLGEPIPSVNQPADEAGRIDAFLRSIPELPKGQDSMARALAPPVPDAYDGVAYTRTVEHVTKTRVADSLAVATPVADVLYPGSVVQGRSVPSGQLAPIPLQRSAGTITLTTDLKKANPASKSATVSTVDLPSIEDARTKLLRDLAPADAATKVVFSSAQARTLEQGFVSLGVTYKGASFGLDVKGSLDIGLKTNTSAVFFEQIFYTVAFTPNASTRPFFADGVTLTDVQKYADMTNPPGYLEQVDYGRSLFILITGSASWTDLDLAIKAAINNIKLNIDLDVKYKKTIDESQIRVLATGGPTAATMALLHDPMAELPHYLDAGGPFTPDNPGSPLRYTIRYAGTRDVQAVTQTADYDETVDVTGQEVRQTFQVWDGPTGGPKSTNILVAAGDRVDVTATGTNWSGVWLTGDYGPDGWTTWAHPGGGGVGYPLPSDHPFALCGTYDNDPHEWFYIGPGRGGPVSFQQPGATSRTLWLGTNDNNPKNGDDNKRFTVNVHVTRRTKEQLGLAGVGRSM